MTHHIIRLLVLFALMFPAICYAGSDEVGIDRQGMLAARLTSAGDHICAYTGPDAPECHIARNFNHIRWAEPLHPAPNFTQSGGFQPDGRIIWIDVTIQYPPTLGALLLHEASHWADADRGLCCNEALCLGTETRAYQKEFSYWKWLVRTWGPPQLLWIPRSGDDVTSFLNQIASNADYAQNAFPRMPLASCLSIAPH